MEASFWHGTWEPYSSPYAAKSLDVHWLLSNGYRVAGAELSKIAIEQLFAELRVKPTITAMGKISHWSATASTFSSAIFSIFHAAISAPLRQFMTAPLWWLFLKGA